MQGNRSTLRDIIAGTLLLAALALPFMPVPGDGAARIKVHFRTAGMANPRAFSAQTSRSICTVMAAALAYENPDGTFTRVNCED